MMKRVGLILVGVILGASGLKAVQVIRRRLAVAEIMRSQRPREEAWLRDVEAHGLRRSPPDPHHDMSMGGLDWSKASDLDLITAPIFVTEARSGLRPALDSLAALIPRDARLQKIGPAGLHQFAHFLGRLGVARARNDPTVFRECGAGFLAGCQHGVMEGYFSMNPPVDSASLAGLCARIAPATPPIAARECAHGMGHGLHAVANGDMKVALNLCGDLNDDVQRRECTDGVFMTQVMHDVEALSLRDSPRMRRCDQFDAKYAASCWSYEPVYQLTIHDRDLARSRAACDSAPANAIGDCYMGFGKQVAGQWPDQMQRTADACRAGNSKFAADCRAGAVAYYTDESWTADRAAGFCRILRQDEKNDCYDALGVAMRATQPDNESLERECRKSEPAFVGKCVTGDKVRKST